MLKVSVEEALKTVENFITKNNALINVVNAQSGRTLLQTILLLQSPNIDMPLVKLMVTNPIFDPRNANLDKDGLTNIQALITHRRLDILRIMATDRRILYTGQSFSYEYAKKQLDLASDQLKQEMAKKSPHIAQAQKIALQLGNILIFFVKATIENAIENDNASLFDRLAKAEFHPTQLIINGKLPFAHLTAKHTELHAWFQRQEVMKSTARASGNPHSFHSSATSAAAVPGSETEQVHAKKDLENTSTFK